MKAICETLTRSSWTIIKIVTWDLEFSDEFRFVAPEINNTLPYMLKFYPTNFTIEPVYINCSGDYFKLTNEEKRTNISFPFIVWIHHQLGRHDQIGTLCITFYKGSK
jgi:hypothetical protein